MKGLPHELAPPLRRLSELHPVCLSLCTRKFAATAPPLLNGTRLLRHNSSVSPSVLLLVWKPLLPSGTLFVLQKQLQPARGQGRSQPYRIVRPQVCTLFNLLQGPLQAMLTGGNRNMSMGAGGGVWDMGMAGAGVPLGESILGEIAPMVTTTGWVGEGDCDGVLVM
jgi:hypothetical protein